MVIVLGLLIALGLVSAGLPAAGNLDPTLVSAARHCDCTRRFPLTVLAECTVP